jgi:hypothetical protein
MEIHGNKSTVIFPLNDISLEYIISKTTDYYKPEKRWSQNSLNSNEYYEFEIYASKRRDSSQSDGK